MDWIGLAQERYIWREFENAVKKLSGHKMRGISWLAAKWLAFQEGLCSME
jgi:hypothetical protein